MTLWWLSHTVACYKAFEVNWGLGSDSSWAAPLQCMHTQFQFLRMRYISSIQNTWSHSFVYYNHGFVYYNYLYSCLFTYPLPVRWMMFLIYLGVWVCVFNMCDYVCIYLHKCNVLWPCQRSYVREILLQVICKTAVCMTFTSLESSFSQLLKCRDRGKCEDHCYQLVVFVQTCTL